MALMKVAAWRTSDGRLFETKAEAATHEVEHQLALLGLPTSTIEAIQANRLAVFKLLKETTNGDQLEPIAEQRNDADC